MRGLLMRTGCGQVGTGEQGNMWLQMKHQTSEFWHIKALLPPIILAFARCLDAYALLRLHADLIFSSALLLIE